MEVPGVCSRFYVIGGRVVSAPELASVDAAQSEKELTAQLDAMTPSEQRYALAFLWGTMTVRDPQACRDALTMAVGW